MPVTSSSSNPIVRERMNRWYAEQEAIARNAPEWERARQRWAQEAGDVALPPHIANLQHAVANSEAPLRTEVRAEVEAEIQRRLAAHKENSHA